MNRRRWQQNRQYDWPILRVVGNSSGWENLRERWYHDLAKWLSYYLYFFFFFFYLGLTTQKRVWESVMSQVSHNRSHDRHRKVVHRPYSTENLTGTLLSSLCQMLIKSSWLNFGLELALWQLCILFSHW